MFHVLRILQLNSARKYVGEAAHTLNLTEALRQRGHAVWLGLRKGHETFERAALNLAPEALAAICVARFARVKAHDVLLTAWKTVQERLPGARLILVGAGKFLDETRTLAAALGIQDSVTFLGKRADIPALLD